MPRRSRVSAAMLVLSSCIPAVAGATELELVPQEPAFAPAVEEYKAIWNVEGARIVGALETATGLRIETGPIRVIVCECVSYWVELWGKEFADAQVVVESGRRGYDYESAWRDALALGSAGRTERWRNLREQWQP